MTNTDRNSGRIAPFGGGVHKGESTIQCAKRELSEELNLHIEDLQKVGVFESHYRPGEYIELFLAENIDLTILKLNEGKNIIELSLEEALVNKKVTDFTKKVLRSVLI